MAKLTLHEWLNRLKNNRNFMRNVRAWKDFAPREGQFAPFPDWVHGDIRLCFARRGINHLYSHQVDSINETSRGRHVCLVTPTASGKTLCYNLPVLNRILRHPETRALYVFPTKALAQDQMEEIHGLIRDLGANAGAFTYDGDTPDDARQAIRKQGHVVITNPDMLHAGILPHHTKWQKLFANLEFVVLDELHVYRGIFGSHVTNVIRRLRRICRFYGRDPLFICCSATIANPKEHAERILEMPVSLIAKSGAPRAKRTFILYNPPIINRELGIRQSALGPARQVAGELVGNNIQTILFVTSRLNVEVLTKYLKDRFDHKTPAQKAVISGYRGGYLPNLRREIEEGLRKRELKGVVTTNALELGIDIG
ncbi:MAG: DEAD/DEAH box helicase, partial [Syntrophobacterales bacterium]|nr:DEAD/DEAH box helicase [Syntrophobacterales bacterium]